MKATAPTKWLKLSNLVPGKNPRGSDFEVDDLVESLSRNPMLHNVVVRSLPGAREKYEIIAGHRRVAAARKLGLGQVEAKIIEADDLVAEQLALEENLRRKALADEGGALKRLVELYAKQQPSRRGGDRRSGAFGSKRQLGGLVGPVARAAEVTGQSVRDTQRKLRIGKLGSSKVRKAFATGQVNVLEAEQLSGLTKVRQDRQLKVLVSKKRNLPPEMRRVLDAFRYVELNLRRQKTGGVAKVTLVELETLAKNVAEIIKALASARGRRSTRKKLAAKTVALKPQSKVSDAVSFEPKSYNRKLSMVGSIAAEDRPRPLPMKPYVSATTVSIQTSCPDSCVFKSTPGSVGGCYADAGFTRIKIRQLDESAKGYTSTDLIKEEVRQIDAAFRGGRIPQDGDRGGRDLRLHVAGDVQTPEEAELLGAAATRWKERGGGATWSFTHSWREVPRSAWGPDVSVLASVEHPKDILLAKQRGYASAIVVGEFADGDRAFHLAGAKHTRVVPCPAESRGTNCAACRLCLRPDALLKTNAAIAFKIHGQHAGRALAAVKPSPMAQ